MSGDPLDDAQLLYERGQFHIAAYNRLSACPLWRIEKGRDGDLFTQMLVLDRQALRALKPVISDIANNLIHALDHVVAAAYQAEADDRPHLYFPIAPDDDSYARKLHDLEKRLDPKWLNLFASVRERHKLWQGYLCLLKRLSNDVKHWQLVAGGAGAAAVAWNVPGKAHQDNVGIPKDHFVDQDFFVFWSDSVPFPTDDVLIMTQHRFENLGGEAASVDSVFSTCSRFVADIIAESRKLFER